MADSLADSTIVSILVAYLEGIHIMVGTLRDLLTEHDGYECKEPEPGKFTLAFRYATMVPCSGSPATACYPCTAVLGNTAGLLLCYRSQEAAIRCCTALQLRLLSAAWPSQLLQWAECREVLGDAGEVLWRGLRVRAGIAFGRPDHKKPLNTGRDMCTSIRNNILTRVK